MATIFSVYSKVGTRLKYKKLGFGKRPVPLIEGFQEWGSAETRAPCGVVEGCTLLES